MLYIYDELDKLDEQFIPRCDHLLSDERRQKLSKQRIIESKNQSAVVYLLLRTGLSEEYGIIEPVRFNYSDKGKPSIAVHPNIHFNLSHCKRAAVCLISENTAGVDVQHISHISKKLAKRVFTTKEYEYFLDSENPDEYFCEMWTIKECYLKKTGQGIGADLWNLSAESIKEKTIYKGKDYFCCASEKDVRVKKVSYEMLMNFIER